MVKNEAETFIEPKEDNKMPQRYWQILVEEKRNEILDQIKNIIRKILNTNKRIKLALILNKEGELYTVQLLNEQEIPTKGDELIIDIFQTGEFSILDHIKKYSNKEIKDYLDKNNLLEFYEAYNNNQEPFKDSSLQFYYFIDQLNGTERDKLRNAIITDLIYDYINNYDIIPYYQS